jgi:hypothetical protein
MPLKTLGPIGPRAVRERVNKLVIPALLFPTNFYRNQRAGPGGGGGGAEFMLLTQVG